MNRLLFRQLKRHFGWQDEAACEAALSAIELGRLDLLPPEKIRGFLTAVAEAYEQGERDLELRSRSLELSSTELTQANQDLRQEAIARQRVIDSLWDTTNVLLQDLGRPTLARDQTNLEQLSNLMLSLVQEKQQAEAAMLRKEAQFSTLVGNIPGVVFRCQLEYPWSMLFINQQIHAITGYTPEAFMGDAAEVHYGEFIQASDLPAVEQVINNALAGDGRYNIEYRIHHRDGAIRWVFERGQVVRSTEGHALYLDGIIFDITEQKHAAERLRQLSAAIEASPSPVVITNAQGLIEYINPKFESILGYQMDDVKQRRLDFFVAHPVDHARFQSLWAADVTPELDWHYDILHRHRRGHELWMSLSISPIYSEEQGMTHYVAVYEDIDVRKNAEAQLVAAKEAADQANQLKSDFLANMSHEIRTPMNAILGMTHLTLKTDLSSKQRDYLQKTSAAAESLLHILNDILDFSKIEANRLQIEITPFRLASVIEQVCALHQMKAEEKGLSLNVTLAADCPPAVIGDPLRLGQILNNLVGNAIKFTQKGSVNVHLERVAELDKQIRLHATVQDSGIGLNADQIKKLFKPFSQADGSTTRKFGGTGLGLSISKRLVELMGGDIWVESTPNIGSIFHFTLLLDKCHEAQLQAENDAHRDAKFLHGIRILLVEDNPLNQQVASELLSGVGASVILAQHGGEALGWLSIEPLPCDVILMDLQMPVLDGNETTRLLRSDPRLQSVPIIAMTAHAMSDERQRCLDAGMNDYVTKPIQPDILFATIAKWVGDKITTPEICHTPFGYFDESLFPVIEGVDTHDVVARLMGDVQLYEMLFRQFLHDYQAADQQFEQLLGSDWQAAERLAHSIKGVAGTLGMSQLAEVAAKLEQRLRLNPGDAGDLKLAFTSSLNQMLQAVAKVYPAQEPTPPEFAFNTPDVMALFDELEQLLQNYDGDAVDRYEQLQLQLKRWPDQKMLDRLGYAITSDFNFVHAQQYLQELKQAVWGASHG
ncbi:PAS domain S-box protein [Chitinibacter fontanus]|uniref:Sensory/regulatory protein RpfC n=1 Tax=Chitinibacter fontanus TaxID=1737446 RepID=A0A7D5ZFC0_9NEIS|nr:ATP-binding protein [Chitinibacter fontanus]QLI81448.1 PAS domain S-box protein [Chitinibacter fontanus]